MSDPVYSVVIRSFNEEKHIGRLIDGIRQQSVSDQTEIILVDSGSTDNTVRIARHKGARIVQIEPAAFSFGRALNIGCQAAAGQFLLFASAHVYPLYTDWIELLSLPFRDPAMALVYGKQVGNEQTKYSEHQLFAKWFPKTSNYNQQTPFCNNANTMIRKSLWETQPYDEQLTGLEDIDWAVKIMAKGNRIAYEAGAPIVHVHEETPKKVKNRYRREAIALKNIFPREKFHFADYMMLLSSNIFTDCVHAVRDGVFTKEVIGVLKFRTMQFTGTWLGFRQTKQLTDSLKRRLYYPNEFQKQADPDTIFHKAVPETQETQKTVLY